MADVKISALVAATTPLDGTEVVPIVQSSTTKKVAISDITAGRAMSMGDLTYTGTLTGSTGVLDVGSGQIYKDSSGNVGIGTSSPISTIGKALHVYNSANTGSVASNTIVCIESANRNAVLDLSGTSTSTNSINFSDTPGTTLASIASSLASSNLLFRTGGASERMQIDNSGNVLVTSAGGLGYGTGAGGTVTQTTSKATSVTLNRPAGQITMDAAALAAGAVVSFTLNNSLITIKDTVLLNIVETVASNNYQLWCGIGSGTATINLLNRSAGSLSESVVFNFCVIKGETS